MSIKESTKNNIAFGLSILSALAILGSAFKFYRDLVFKEDLTTVTSSLDSTLKEHTRNQSHEFKNLLCFVCRLPELSTDSKCTESGCTAKVSFQLKNEKFEFLVVKDDTPMRTVADTSSSKIVRIDDRLYNVNDNSPYKGYSYKTVQLNKKNVDTSQILYKVPNSDSFRIDVSKVKK